MRWAGIKNKGPTRPEISEDSIALCMSNLSWNRYGFMLEARSIRLAYLSTILSFYIPYNGLVDNSKKGEGQEEEDPPYPVQLK
jgi:hypothetical protein